MSHRVVKKRPYVSSTLAALLPSTLGLIAALPTPSLAQEAPLAPLTFPRSARTVARRIESITIFGAHSLSREAIIALTNHKEGDLITEQTLSEMTEALLQSGYFGMHHLDHPEDAVKIRSEERNDHPGWVNILIEVDENDTIHQYNITGSGPIKPEEIQSHLHLGLVYNTAQVSRDLHDIQALYNKQGYVVTFGQDLGMDSVRSGVLNLPILVARVAEIQILGNRKTRPFVIRRELETRVGDYYNRNTLREDLRRLTNLNLFKEIDPQELSDGSGKVRVLLNVVEKSSGLYNGGVSAGGTQGLTGFFEVSDANFRGAGESARLHLERGITGNAHTEEISFTEPHIDRRRTSLSVDLYDRAVYPFASGVQNAALSGLNSSSNIYAQQRVGASLAVNRALSRNLYVGVNLRGESVQTNPIGLTGNNIAILQDGPIFSLGGHLSHNNVDYAIDPATGGAQSLLVTFGQSNLQTPQITASPLPSEAILHHYVKSEIDWRQFVSLQGPRRPGKPEDERSTLAFRVLAGSSAGTLPFTEQYFVGGGDTIRGYQDGRFWGSNVLLGSIELRQPIAKGFKGVLFADVGDAWGGSFENVNLQGLSQDGFHPRAGAGIGLRVHSGFGLLRLDYGVSPEGGKIHFGFGQSF